MRPELIGKFGEKARRWKGDKAGYVAKHLWIIKHHGNASYCLFNPSHKSKPYEWANVSKTYKRTVDDYIPLCTSCHQKWDHGDICKYGHVLTTDNIYSPPKHPTWRNCRKCQLLRNQQYATSHQI